MNWKQLCEHKNLKDLPFKIELNAQGRIIMTPVKVSHSLLQGKLSGLLYFHLPTGQALVECAVLTKKGTKVADVAWSSPERLETIKSETECSIAPEICIEVLSDSNTKAEIEGKFTLYREAGAKEVWICDEEGNITFYHDEGKWPNSLLAPHFPKKI